MYMLVRFLFPSPVVCSYFLLLRLFLNTSYLPANRPDLIGIVPIFELQNLKKWGHIFQFSEEKKNIFIMEQSRHILFFLLLELQHAGMHYLHVMYHLKDWS